MNTRISLRDFAVGVLDRVYNRIYERGQMDGGDYVVMAYVEDDESRTERTELIGPFLSRAEQVEWVRVAEESDTFKDHSLLLTRLTHPSEVTLSFAAPENWQPPTSPDPVRRVP